MRAGNSVVTECITDLFWIYYSNEKVYPRLFKDSSSVYMLLYKIVPKLNIFLPSIKDEWVGKYRDNENHAIPPKYCK